MRILVFHGYLLEGTGSNVYNARLAATLAALGHDVHLLCQDRHPGHHRFIDAAGDWDGGALRVRSLRGVDDLRERSPGQNDSSGCCTVYRPDIAGLLPVYVADRYEGIEARTFAQCSDAEIARYLDANVAAVRDVAGHVQPDLALANHLIMGPAILARALPNVPYAVTVHGSALEYTVKADPPRFLPFARDGLALARTVLVGSHHTARSLWDALDDLTLPARTRLGPPGVDVHSFHPLAADHVPPDARAASVRALATRLRHHATAPAAPGRGAPTGAVQAGAAPTGALQAGAVPTGAVQAGAAPAPPDSAFARDDDAAAQTLERLSALLDQHDDTPLVAFVGKLIVSKGTDLLLAAWPLVLERVPAATLLIVGFGAYRATLERLLAALAAGRLDEVRAIADAGRALERDAADSSMPVAAQPAVALSAAARPAADTTAVVRSAAPPLAAPLRHLLAFLDTLTGERRTRYLAVARTLPARVHFTGRLDHDELPALLPACEAIVVPSTFPEAFGMVAVEGAACGALPVSAAHSGLAEVSDVLAGALPAAAARLLSFPVDDAAIESLAERICAWLLADPPLRARTRSALVATVRERWSWEGVARGVLAAARGEHTRLLSPLGGDGQ